MRELGDSDPEAQALAEGELLCEGESLPWPLLERTGLPVPEVQPLPEAL